MGEQNEYSICLIEIDFEFRTIISMKHGHVNTTRTLWTQYNVHLSHGHIKTAKCNAFIGIAVRNFNKIDRNDK